jgi:hypothetical protein
MPRSFRRKSRIVVIEYLPFLNFVLSKLKLKGITKEFIKDFIAGNDCSLKPCQPGISVPIIQRMYSKMKAGIRFADIIVHKGVIVNGHHRYIASLLANFEVGQAEGGKPGGVVIEWQSVVYEDEDWDQPWQIEEFNRQDAEFNDVTVESILEITR